MVAVVITPEDIAVHPTWRGANARARRMEFFPVVRMPVPPAILEMRKELAMLRAPDPTSALAVEPAVTTTPNQETEKKPDPVVAVPRVPKWQNRVTYIQKIVASEYGFSRAQLLMRIRTAEYVRPRQIAMTICSDLVRKAGNANRRGSWPGSLLRLSEQFGVDHTTVLHGIRKVRRLIDSDPDFALEYHALRDRIAQGFA